MANLYIGVISIITLITFLCLFIWSFLTGTKNILRNILSTPTRFIIAFTIYLGGMWVWIYFSTPNIVTIFWYFILLNITIGGLSGIIAYIVESGSFTKLPVSVIINVLTGILLFAVFFGIDKFIPLLVTLGLYFSIILGSIRVSDLIKENANANSITQVFDIGRIMLLRKALFSLVIVMLTLPLIMGTNLLIYSAVDRATYFEQSVQTSESDLPFRSKMDGTMLRVVDYDLAESIMKKSNRLGSNTRVTNIHLGYINGSTYWIGAVIFDGDTFIRQDLNHYQGFIAVDFRDPDRPPIIIEQNFYVGDDLSLDNKLRRVIYDFDPNYIAGDNSYFTMGSDGRMRLIVPYSIKASPVFAGVAGAGIITQEIDLLGGVLEIESDRTITDYKDLSQLPPYARVQYYSENWLEGMVQSWGNSITEVSPERKFGTLTSWGGIFKSPWKMGIDDDVRVVIDPDTRENVQYFLLESTGSDNQVLRGAMKANETGIFFYDWSEYGFIDSNAAQRFANTEITNQLDTTTHGYETLLPLLYPIRDNPKSMEDYAYVIPLQFRGVRFGGVVILDPSDKTGSNNAVKIVDSDSESNITKVIDQAIEEYFSGSSGAATGDLQVNSIFSYVRDGYSVYVLSGDFTSPTINATLDVVFEQERILDEKDWLKVVTVASGDTLSISLVFENDVYYAVAIHS